MPPQRSDRAGSPSGLPRGRHVRAVGLLLDARPTNIKLPRTIEIVVTLAAVATANVLIALTAAHRVDILRWWTFGLRGGLAGVSLIASATHELSSERVRHELEVCRYDRRRPGRSGPLTRSRYLTC
jgi:hypothetical protein